MWNVNGTHQGNGDKDWLLDFDGWELPAYCYVNWHVPEQPVPTDGLTRNTIQRVQQDKHRVLADQILSLPARTPEPEPGTSREISDEDILRFLIVQGLRPSAADELTTTFRRIRRLADYYCKHSNGWKEIREHETRTFLVVPLLLALGWAEQQLKIEFPCAGGRVDIACFPGPYSGDGAECSVLIETKDFATGLDFAPDQARRYADSFPKCRVLVVTNGWCYKAYVRDGGNRNLPRYTLGLHEHPATTRPLPTRPTARRRRTRGAPTASTELPGTAREMTFRNTEQLHWWLLRLGDIVIAIAPSILHADMQRALATATMHYTIQ